MSATVVAPDEGGGEALGVMGVVEAKAALHAQSPVVRRALATLHGARVHAVCGIGNPQRFFATLADAGIDVVPHAFPDHHAFTAADLEFDTDTPVVMTEKDAVKCERFAAPNHWYLPVTAELPDAFCARLERALAQPGPAVESGA